MMRIIKTRLGDFPVRRKTAAGISIYKSGRDMRWNWKKVKIGDYFAATHMREIKPPMRLCNADYVTSFLLDGTEVDMRVRAESADLLRAVKAELVKLINGCCGDQAGKQFCESFGCGTLKSLLETAEGKTC